MRSLTASRDTRLAGVRSLASALRTSGAAGTAARWKLAALLCGLVLLATGCGIDTTVRVAVHDDGSGVVTVVTALDADAVRAAETGGGHLEDRVRLADLRHAGWTVRPWVRAKDGSARLSVSKAFGTPAQLASVLREVNGTAGPVRDVQLTRDDGLLTTDYRVRGRLDLGAAGTGITGDPAVVQSLSAQHVDPAAVDAALLGQLRSALHVRVVVASPGGTRTVVGRPGASVPIDVSTSVADTRRLLLAVVAAVALVGAVLLWWWPARPRGRGRIRTATPASRRASPGTR